MIRLRGYNAWPANLITEHMREATRMWELADEVKFWVVREENQNRAGILKIMEALTRKRALEELNQALAVFQRECQAEPNSTARENMEEVSSEPSQVAT